MININELIDRNYITVSILEDMQQIAEWLSTRHYFAVKDESLDIIGIVTRDDVARYPVHQIIDANIIKPHAYPTQSMFEVYELMEARQLQYLPVYDGGDFIGVISLAAITRRSISYLRELNG